jgi:hypothetical protein
MLTEVIEYRDETGPKTATHKLLGAESEGDLTIQLLIAAEGLRSVVVGIVVCLCLCITLLGRALILR